MTRSTLLVLVFALAGAGALLPTNAHAQHFVFVGASFYYPFYNPWYGWGYPYWYPYAYPPYGYPGPYDGSASLRLQVEPKETEVFIDGHYAGTVDDFDGFFQRLRVEPGEHDIQLYLPGHRSMSQKVYLQPTGSFRVTHTMQPLAAGDTPDPRPVPPPTPPSQPSGRYDPSGRPGPERPYPAHRSPEFGSLAIRVQPQGADVFVDGEWWDSPGNSDRLVIQLGEGEHQIEIRREGFSTYSSTVRVQRGETTTLNVSLVRE